MQISTTTKLKPYRLAYEDAISIWLRYWQGEFQHNIAASYGVNRKRCFQATALRSCVL